VSDQAIKKNRFQFAHIAWLLLFLSFQSILVRSDDLSASSGMADLIRISTVGLSCLIALMCIVRRKDGVYYLFRSSFPLLLIYAVISIISGSYASHSFYSIWKSIEVIVNIFVVVAVLAQDDQRRSVLTLYAVSIVSYYALLLSVWMGALIDPSNAFSYARGILNLQLSGLFPPINPNTVGFLGAFLSFVAIVRFVRTRWSFRRFFYLVLLGIAFPALILSQARTSLIAFVVAIVVFTIMDRRKGLLILIVFAAISAYSVDSLRQESYDFFRRGQTETQFTTLSGRTLGWKAAWNYFLKSPYFGHGFASAGKFDVLGGGSASTLHGAVFDVLVGVGIVGFVPWIAGIAWTGILLIRRRTSRDRFKDPDKRSMHSEMIALYAMLLVKTLTDSGLALHSLQLMLFLIVVAWTAISEPVAQQATRTNMEEPVYANPARA